MSELPVYTGYKNFDSILGYAVYEYIETKKIPTFETHEVSTDAVLGCVNALDLFETTIKKKTLHGRRIKAIYTLHREYGLSIWDIQKLLIRRSWQHYEKTKEFHPDFNTSKLMQWSQEYFEKKPMPNWVKKVLNR